MRQMKEDAEKFRQWKQQKDKEVIQLKERVSPQPAPPPKSETHHESLCCKALFNLRASEKHLGNALKIPLVHMAATFQQLL